MQGLHKRAALAARELRGARHAVAGRVPEEAAPLDVGHREPGHRAAEDPAVHGAPALGGRDLLQAWKSVHVQEASLFTIFGV